MEPLFEAEDLSVGYGWPLVKDISFAAFPGELVAILGRNGCGKTTLLRGLAGSIRRYSGSIRVLGRDITALSVRQQARLLSLLPQQSQVLAGISPRQLMEMGRYPYGGPWGPHPETRRLPEIARLLGIEALLDGDCSKLSQGQRQLAQLGRLLMQDTPVMLLDEPNAALDYDNTFALFRILRDVAQNQNKTALLVLHDPELALGFCHRLLIMKDGRLCHVLERPDAGAAQAALRSIYPEILVREDPISGRLRCDHGGV